MKVLIVDYFPTSAGAEEGVFYFNRKNKSAKLYRNGSVENYYAVLPNLGEPGSRYADSDNDGIADIREASTNDFQDIGWRPADGSTFNKPAYTNSSGVVVSAVQVGIGSLNNLQYILFNGSGSSISISAEYNGAIKRHNNDWVNFVKGQSLTINDGDYLLYNQFVDSDGDGTPDSLDAFPNDPNEDTDADGDGIGSNADIDDTNPIRGSGVDTDGDGTDDELDSFPNDNTKSKYDQQLSWNEFSAGMLLSASPISLSATTDSGETISYSVTSGPASINGNVLTLNSAGTITVEASAPGNATYNPRTISRNFNITDDVTDTDGDGTPDSSDSDNTDGPLGDADGDGTPNNQDGDNTDGPLGDSDGDGVINQDDVFPNDSTKSKYDQQLTFTTFDINASNLKLSEGPWTVDGVTDSGEQLTYSITGHDGTSYFTGNVLTINDLGTPALGNLIGTITIVITAPGNNTYNPLSHSETFNLVDDIVDTDGDGTADYYDSDNTDGPLADIDGDGIINENDSDNTDGPLGDQDGDGILNNIDSDFVPAAGPSFLGIKPVQLSGSSVAAFNQVYEHVGGHMTSWTWPFDGVTSNSTNRTQGYVGLTPPAGGWAVYRGVTDPNVYAFYYNGEWRVGGPRTTNIWSNWDAGNGYGLTNYTPVGFTAGPVGVLASTHTGSEHEFHNAQGWTKTQVTVGSSGPEPNVTLTLIDTEGNGNVQTALSFSDFYDLHFNVASVLNRASNLFLAGTVNYNWTSHPQNSNPRRAFNGDLTTSLESATFMDANASDGGFVYADIVNAGAGPTDSGWIGLDLFSLQSAQRKITQYEINSLVVDEQTAQGTDLANGGSDPKDWTFEGSNNGTNWTVLDTQTNQSFSDASMNGELKQYNFINTTEYRYYRLNVSANHGASRFGVQELRFNYFPQGTL